MGLRLPARVTLILACLAILAPTGAGATELTRVASSFDAKNPFDLDFSIGYLRTQRRGKITREFHQENHIADVLELRYSGVTQEMPMRLAIGLFRDLELRAGASLIFGQTRNVRYPAERDDRGKLLVSDANSTIHNNCANPRGGYYAESCLDGSGNGAQPIFEVPEGGVTSFRSGLGNAYVGLAWAAMSDERDDTKPKWVLSFDYTAPSASVSKPWLATTDSNQGPVGDGAHRFTFSTAISKRSGAIDPYVKFQYSLPLAAGNAVTNCSNPDLAGYAENCNAAGTPWTKSETGLKPPHVGGFLFGAEFYPFDNPEKKQRVGVDLQVGALYVSEGRTYNELSDALGKLLYNEEYLTLGGSFGLYARPVEYVQLRLNTSLYTDTEHFLTNEPVGKDLDGACRGDPSARCVDLDNSAGEINPNFDFRYDMPGRRFRISEVTVFSVMATMVANF